MAYGLLLAGAMLSLLYVLLPYGQIASLLYVVTTALAAVAIMLAVWLRSLFRPAAWLLIAAALALAAMGHGIWYWLDLQGLEPFPSLADVFYLAVYPLFMAALWILGDTNEQQAHALSDALIVGIAAAVLGWALLIAPYIHNPDLTLGQLLVSAGYPVADLIVLPMMLRLVFLQRTRLSAHLFLLAGMIAYFTADMFYAHGNSVGWYVPGGLTDAGWLLSYTLFAAAAWHTSAIQVPQPLRSGTKMTSWRLMILAAAAVPVPVLILFLADSDPGLVRFAAVATILLFVLIMYRMAGLVRETQRQAEVLQQLALTDPLTGAANQRHLVQLLEREIAYAMRRRTPLGVACFELDQFDAFNAQYGHAAGGALQQDLVLRWGGVLRATDILARTGEGVFVVVLPDVPIIQMQWVMERLRARVPYQQTCSVGLTLHRHGEAVESLITRADAAMRQARERGGDGVVLCE